MSAAPFALMWMGPFSLSERRVGQECFIETACRFTEGRKGLGGGSGRVSAFPAPPKAPGSPRALPYFFLYFYEFYSITPV